MTGDGAATAGEVEVERVPMGVAGFSFGGGDIKLPGVAGLAGVADVDEGGDEGLNGDGCGAVVGEVDGLKGDD